MMPIDGIINGTNGIINQNPNDLNYQKQIIDIFLNSIYVYDDRYVFTYNFHGGTETIPREAVEEAFGSDLTRLAPQAKGHPIGWSFCLWRIRAY